jgi:hypothetical protein
MTTKAPPDPSGGAFASAQHVLTDRDAAMINRRGRQHQGIRLMVNQNGAGAFLISDSLA